MTCHLSFADKSTMSEEVEMSRHRRKIAVLLGMGLTIVLGTHKARGAEPKVGDRAPAFSLAGSDGKVHALADYQGKSAVVLAWFPKAFTGG
jgi:peroxiredoxin Q/BCP